jgi:hypothetical protein
MAPRKILTATFVAALAFFVTFSCKTGSSEVTANTEQPVATATPKSNEPITVAAVGDIMMGSPFPNDSRMPPNDGADLLKPFTPILSSADITFGNLEGPMIDEGVSAKCGASRGNCFAFRVPTRYGKYLKEAGFDVMGVANNHAGDFGEAGRISTEHVLDEQGIKYAGSLQPPATTAYLNVKGQRVAVIGFGHNNGMPSINDLDTARQYVLDAKRKADIVIVSFHGGGEGTDHQHVKFGSDIFLGENRGNLPAFAHTVIDAGADLVLGHGPHVMRGMELYKGHLIEYSMGNFCTYGWFQLAAETALTEVLEIKIGPDGKFISGKIHPGKQEGRGGPVPDPSGESIRVLRNLSIADFGPNAPNIADDGTVTPK